MSMTWESSTLMLSWNAAIPQGNKAKKLVPICTNSFGCGVYVVCIRFCTVNLLYQYEM